MFRPLSVLAVTVGVLGGVIGAAYVGALRLLESLIGTEGRGGIATIGVLVAVGVGVSVLIRWLGDPGDVELLVDNIHISGGSDDARALRSLIPVSLLGIAAGGALGPEAPLVQTAGTAGTVVGKRSACEPDRIRILTITGMASAFTVLFGAPLGSAIFALEILHRRGLEYYEALMPALGGALIGFGVFLALERTGFGPVFELPTATVGDPQDLAWAALAATAGAAIAVAFTIVVRISRRAALGLPSVLRPAVGGLVIGSLSLWSFAALTFGEKQIADIPTLSVAGLVAALVSKLVASAVCAATGWRGGFIIPLFFCGASAGMLLHHALPGVDTTMLMVACMVATNVGVTKTPLGSTLVVTEMAGLRLLPTTTLAAVVAIVLTSEIHLIESQRARTHTP